MPKAFVKIRMKGLRGVRAQLRTGLSGGRTPAFQMLENWGLAALTFLQKRFRKFSAGGGDWKPLAASTLKADKGRRLGILRKTSAIYFALFKGSAGNVFQVVGRFIRIGFGGPGRHPGSEISVAGLAIIHNTGAGNVPQRKIIVNPDLATVNQMKIDARNAFREMIRKAS